MKGQGDLRCSALEEERRGDERRVIIMISLFNFGLILLF